MKNNNYELYPVILMGIIIMLLIGFFIGLKYSDRESKYYPQQACDDSGCLIPFSSNGTSLLAYRIEYRNSIYEKEVK